MTGETSRHVYRVDQFVVPDSAREEFLGRVRGTHQLLKAQPGFVRDVVLEQTAGPGRFNFVTLVEWRSQSAMDAAKAVVTAAHAKSGFNPHGHRRLTRFLDRPPAYESRIGENRTTD